MNHIFCILFLLCMCGITWAQEYKLTEIEEIAFAFFNQPELQSITKGHTSTTKRIASLEAIRRDTTNYMYLVNAEDSSGWVILANEKQYPSIIAYGDDSHFTYDESNIPPALLCILDNHMNAIDSTRKNATKITRNIYDTRGIVIEEQKGNLIDGDKWRQECSNDSNIVNPAKTYNKFSPFSCNDICGKAYAGCGPVAMSKILRYWQWPDYAEIEGVHDTTYYYDWKNMPRSIDNTTEMYQVDAVAHLFRSCGQAAATAYTCNWTATVASEIHDAMQDVFGFHSDLVRDWEDVDISSMLVNEIDNRRPVLVQAHQATIFQGHSFVVDGYRRYSDQQVKFHVHFGHGADDIASNNYCDLTFNGYKNGQKFLIELYPMCNHRSSNVSLDNSFTIAADDNRTYYSTNNIAICSNSNSIIVNSGGHLLVKAGNEVRLKPGFHAKAGSEVHITINDSLCNSSQAINSLQHIASRFDSAPTNNTEPTDEVATSSSLENIASEMIQSTSIYTISGQLLQNFEGKQNDISNLPNGMYILQYRMNDDRIRSKKIAITK